MAFRLRYDNDSDTDQFFTTRELAVQQIGEDFLINPDAMKAAEVTEVTVRDIVTQPSSDSRDTLSQQTVNRERRDLGYLVDYDQCTWYRQHNGTYRMACVDGDWHLSSEFDNKSEDDIRDKWGIARRG